MHKLVVFNAFLFDVIPSEFVNIAYGQSTTSHFKRKENRNEFEPIYFWQMDKRKTVFGSSLLYCPYGYQTSSMSNDACILIEN